MSGRKKPGIAIIRHIMTRHLKNASALAFSMLLLVGNSARAGTLEAAAIRVDITPPPGLLLQGFPHPDRIAIGTRDPLNARILVLAAGPTRIAIVNVDLIATFAPEYLERLRIATQSDVQNILVAATHTHSGPPLIPGDDGQEPRQWESEAVSKIAAAVHQAATELVPAQIGVGYDVAYIGGNRLRKNLDGSVTWFERNGTRIPTAPVDPTVAVLRVDDMNGQPIAILVNYACHPVTFGPDQRLYSADFPGVMVRVVEKEMGGKGIAFYLQGGAGDINPFFPVTPLQAGSGENCEWTGTTLGLAAARAAKSIRTVADNDAMLQIAQDTLTFHDRWDRDKLRKTDPGTRAEIEAGTRPEYKLRVTTLVIDKRIAFLSMPGEPFVDFQMQWRSRCPVEDCFFLGYTDGYFGYLPSITAATWGEYGASMPSTFLEVGAGEAMLDHGVIRTLEMIGRLKPIPEDLGQ